MYVIVIMTDNFIMVQSVVGTFDTRQEAIERARSVNGPFAIVELTKP